MNKLSLPTLILALVMLGSAPAMSFAASNPEPKAPWVVTYQDGSGNGYRFWKNSESEAARFEYSPVQPKESSTGMYSGGAPANGVLNPKQAEELWKRILRLESDATLREQARMKGTGAFRLKDLSGDREFIITNGPPLVDWNQFMSLYRRGAQGLIQ